MARARCSFTLYDCVGFRRVLEARNVRHLADLIVAETCWTLTDCILLAERLYRGEGIVCLDFETIILPGDLTLYHSRPDEDADRVAARYRA